jgi:hypothetical protein
MDEQDIKYREKYDQYRDYARQKAEIEANMDSIKENVAEFLHADKLNEKIVELSSGERWIAKYQSQLRPKTNLVALMELIGPESYGEIVTQKEITFLTIRKATKEKKENSLTTAKPIETNDMFIPAGTVLS